MDQQYSRLGQYGLAEQGKVVHVCWFSIKCSSLPKANGPTGKILPTLICHQFSFYQQHSLNVFTIDSFTRPFLAVLEASKSKFLPKGQTFTSTLSQLLHSNYVTCAHWSNGYWSGSEAQVQIIASSSIREEPCNNWLKSLRQRFYSHLDTLIREKFSLAPTKVPPKAVS